MIHNEQKSTPVVYPRKLFTNIHKETGSLLITVLFVTKKKNWKNLNVNKPKNK